MSDHLYIVFLMQHTGYLIKLSDNVASSDICPIIFANHPSLYISWEKSGALKLVEPCLIPVGRQSLKISKLITDQSI